MPRPELQLGHVVDTHQDQAREDQGRGGDQEEDIEDGERPLVDDRVCHVDLPGSAAASQ